MIIHQIHTGRTTTASDAEADRRYAAMKQLATRLVRHIKDDATEDAVLLLISHLLDVQLQAQQQLLTELKGQLQAREDEQ